MRLILRIDDRDYEIDLREETVRELEAIAGRNGISLQGAILQAIRNENFLEDQTAAGGRLLIEKDNRLQELVFQPLSPLPA
jgi:hypothetical protein